MLGWIWHHKCGSTHSSQPVFASDRGSQHHYWGIMSAQLDMKTSWLKASSKYGEAILLLRFGMPLANRPFWYNTEELQCMLRQGGLPKLPNRFVSRALKSLKSQQGIEMNTFYNKNWYCFDFNRDKVPYDTPKKQLRSLKGMIAGQKGFIIPALPPNHFSLFELNYLKEYTAIMNEPNFEISTFPSDATTELLLRFVGLVQYVQERNNNISKGGERWFDKVNWCHTQLEAIK